MAYLQHLFVWVIYLSSHGLTLVILTTHLQFIHNLIHHIRRIKTKVSLKDFEGFESQGCESWEGEG